MATETPEPSPSAQVVANVFVEQYYKKLFANPDIVYKFYEDSSTLSRPGLDGVMSSATTMQGIKDKIMSLDYHCYKAEIATVDAQDSFKEGVIVLVTGFLIGNDDLKRRFTQTFFLARHATGYYVLNDVLRFLDVFEAVTTTTANDAIENDMTTFLKENNESAQVPDQQAVIKQTAEKKVKSNGSEVCDSPDMKGVIDSKGPKVKEVIVNKQAISSSQTGGQVPPKMSYASIVAKETTVTSPSQRSTNPVVVMAPSRTNLEKKTSAPQEASTPRRNNTPLNGDNHKEVKGIYVGNLPTNVSAKQLDEVFKKFGPIRKDGIQIRSYEDGFCYGFVEFESSNAAHSAIQAHHIWIGPNEAYITEKRSSNQAGNGKGRPAGKGEFRNDNRRSQENSVEGRRDSRYQNGNRGEFGQNRGLNISRDEFSGQNRLPNRNRDEFSGQNQGRNGDQRA